MPSDIEASIVEHLTRLCVEIGPRPNGSPGNLAAAEYIQHTLRTAGLHVETQQFQCPAWEHEETLLWSNGERIEAAANAFSPPCDVTAATVAVGTVAELEQAELSGRIGLLYGDLTKAPMACKSWFLASERDKHIIRLLEEKAPAALITVQPRAGELERVIADWELPIPSATVNARASLALLQGRDSAVHLRIRSTRSDGRTSNIIGHKAGDNSPRIVMCAHYDTTIDTPGARDNGAGVAVLLTLAQLLSELKLASGLQFVAFGGHEYLPLGDDEYLRAFGDRFGNLAAAVNFDSAGALLGATSIMMEAHSQPFEALVSELVRDYPGTVWVDPWPESNHSTFAWRGVPSIAFSSVGAPRFDHLRSDTVEWVSPAKLSQIVALVVDVAESLEDRPPDWTREPKAADTAGA